MGSTSDSKYLVHPETENTTDTSSEDDTAKHFSDSSNTSSSSENICLFERAKHMIDFHMTGCRRLRSTRKAIYTCKATYSDSSSDSDLNTFTSASEMISSLLRKKQATGKVLITEGRKASDLENDSDAESTGRTPTIKTLDIRPKTDSTRISEENGRNVNSKRKYQQIYNSSSCSLRNSAELINLNENGTNSPKNKANASCSRFVPETTCENVETESSESVSSFPSNRSCTNERVRDDIDSSSNLSQTNKKRKRSVAKERSKPKLSTTNLKGATVSKSSICNAPVINLRKKESIIDPPSISQKGGNVNNKTNYQRIHTDSSLPNSAELINSKQGRTTRSTKSCNSNAHIYSQMRSLRNVNTRNKVANVEPSDSDTSDQSITSRDSCTSNFSPNHKSRGPKRRQLSKRKGSLTTLKDGSLSVYEIPKSKFQEALKILNSDKNRFDETPANYSNTGNKNNLPLKQYSIEHCEARRYKEATYNNTFRFLGTNSLCRILSELDTCLQNEDWPQMLRLLIYGCGLITLDQTTQDCRYALLTYGLVLLMMDPSVNSETLNSYLLTLSATNELDVDTFLKHVNVLPPNEIIRTTLSVQDEDEDDGDDLSSDEL